jgi:hypothetical protein
MRRRLSKLSKKMEKIGSILFWSAAIHRRFGIDRKRR